MLNSVLGTSFVPFLQRVPFSPTHREGDSIPEGRHLPSPKKLCQGLPRIRTGLHPAPGC